MGTDASNAPEQINRPAEGHLSIIQPTTGSRKEGTEMAMKIRPWAVCFQRNVSSVKRGRTLSKDVTARETMRYVQMETIRREELRRVRRRPKRRVDGGGGAACVAGGSGSGVGAIDLGAISLVGGFSAEAWP